MFGDVPSVGQLKGAAEWTIWWESQSGAVQYDEENQSVQAKRVLGELAYLALVNRVREVMEEK